MPLTDQQLRQELLSYGEIVPPITQRNRDQLHARLEILRSRKSSPTRASSPSKTTTTRSRSGRGLIELSDSETDTSKTEHFGVRSVGRGTSPSKIRSNPRGRHSALPSSTSSHVTAEVEESIARHRREIQQLIDSARERSRATNANISLTTISSRPIPSSNSRQAIKTNIEKPKQPSWFTRSKQSIQSFWTKNKSTIFEIFKALFIGCLIGATLILLRAKGGGLLPQRKGISCSRNNATDCDEILPVIDSLRKFLRIRTGEVDCGFLPKSANLVTKSEINKFLDTKGYKFELGKDERWKTLITYIIDKPVDDIVVWNEQNSQVQDVDQAYKLSSIKGIHSFVCRARKVVNTTMQNLFWLLFGTMILLSIVWFIRRRSRKREEQEKKYKEFLEKILNLLENQYEEHLQDPETKRWIAISHIRDMLIPAQDRQRLKPLWERAKKHISENESRVRTESQLIHGEEFDVWQWIQPRSPSPQRRKRTESPANTNEDSYVLLPTDVGLTECLKLRNFFDPNSVADDDEIDLVVDSIQNRCATVRRIEHIGIHSVYVYLKFSSKEAAAQGFHLLNSWKYHGREIVAKYLRLERYHEHFPEARGSS